MSVKGKILIVDDDERICRLVKEFLGKEGYELISINSAAAVFQTVEQFQPDLVILDLIMPDGDGVSIARDLKSQSNELAIIILSGKNDMVDKIVGLEVGADDYITKPFNLRELLARVRVVFRRKSTTAQQPGNHQQFVAQFNGWKFNLKTDELISTEGSTVHLTTHEGLLLKAFIKNSNQTFTREKIAEIVAGRSWDPYDRSIDVLVAKLRKKIEVDSKQPQYIQTLRGAGYKFIAEVVMI